METYNEQGLESPSRNSYIGSYYQPPEKMIPLPRRLVFPFHTIEDSEHPTTSRRVSQSKTNIDSKPVVDALKTLQDKIRRMELETSRQAAKSWRVSQDAQKQQQNTPLTTLPLIFNQKRKETNDDTKLDPVEKCKLLQKQVEITKRSIEKAQKERTTFLENQTLLQKEQFNTNIQLQNDKLERLQSEYEELRRTQTLAEMKLTMLEEKLQKEEHERQLVQQKAEELQREFNSSLRISTKEVSQEIKKKTKKTKKTSRQCESPKFSRNPKMPFVAGQSTSPSHSVHANVQSILHIMKHHQPQLHERVTFLQKSSCGAKKNPQIDFSRSSQGHHSASSECEGSLSDLVLALQDELGQMSFEHRELIHQIDDTHDHKKRQDLKNELEQLVTRMEDKGAQITKLRKHQQMVHKLTKDDQQASRCRETPVIHPPAPSPIKAKRKAKKQPCTQSNLQLLRETQRFRSSLKESDVLWET